LKTKKKEKEQSETVHLMVVGWYWIDSCVTTEVITWAEKVISSLACLRLSHIP